MSNNVKFIVYIINVFISFNVMSEYNNNSWHKGMLKSDESFIDLSYLNHKPAGKYGFVKVENDRFIYSNNQNAKFFGVNIQGDTLFITDKELIKKHAQRLAKLGFNLVRLHHHDSVWLKSSLIKDGNTSQHINEKSLDSYFWWIKCLRDEGIYVWIDLQVQRPWRVNDEIPGWESDFFSKKGNQLYVGKGLIYLNSRMQQLTKKFNTIFLTEINPYTNLSLKDDPAVMGVHITNENDITAHYGNRFLKNKGYPYHHFLFENKVQEFSKRHRISKDELAKTWEPGLSKYLLNDIEATFNIDMIKYLRKIGVKVPISTTSIWGKHRELFSLPSLTVGDFIDAHAYMRSDKNIMKVSPENDSSFLYMLGQGQVKSKPYTISEYNIESFNKYDTAYVPVVLTTTMASFQGWDAMMLYGYSQDAFRGDTISPWSSYFHPSIMGVVPAMALMYRENHVSTALKTITYKPNLDDVFLKGVSSQNSLTIRSALEKHRLVVLLPESPYLTWLKSENENIGNSIDNSNINFTGNNKYKIISDTGEIVRDLRNGIIVVNTPKSKLVMGNIKKHQITLDDIEVTSNNNSIIALTSMDTEPLTKSKRILLTALGVVYKDHGKSDVNYVSQPVRAKILFSSHNKNLYVAKLSNTGSEKGRVQLDYDATIGKYIFQISGDDKTHWYIIKEQASLKDY